MRQIDRRSVAVNRPGQVKTVAAIVSVGDGLGVRRNAVAAAIDMDIKITKLIIIGGIGILDQRYTSVGDGIVGLIPSHAVNAAPAVHILVGGRPPSGFCGEFRPRAIVDLIPHTSLGKRGIYCRYLFVGDSGIVLGDGIVIQRTSQIVPRGSR